jgi:4-cresol dehydrogenase (hydroxylating) flavoprotein subunit
MHDLQSTIDALGRALGEDKVFSDDATRDRYARTTQVAARRPAAIVFPTSTDEIQAVVRAAAEQGVVLYPIARGKNWGYGDACAPTDNAVIVDLSRMNRILEVNEELAYAVIEPGVSQQQFYEHLQTHNIPLWFDCTGAGLDASIVGNSVERGFGHTRYGDHLGHTCGIEIVLGDGRVVRTGYTHYPNARAGYVYPYGVGPFLDGLFTQSNFGIITKIGIWLMPIPEQFVSFYLPVPRHEDLAPLIDRLRPLRLAGMIASAVHIANDVRLMSATGRYPWHEANDVTPLPDALRASIRQQKGYGHWNVAGSITGTRAQVRATKRALKRSLRGLGRLIFVRDQTIRLANRILPVLNRCGIGRTAAEQVEVLTPNHNLLKGVPTNEPLRGAQWRLRHAPDGAPGDPLDYGCGLMWASPVMPMTGRDAETVMGLCEPIFAHYGFEPLVTFTLINERAMIAVLNVSFDKAVAEEASRAEKCYDALMSAMIAEGYYPYRAGLRGMPKLWQDDGVFWEVASQIKKALDPNDIIARGRYIPPRDAAGGD